MSSSTRAKGDPASSPRTPVLVSGGVYCPIVTPFLACDHPQDPEGLDLDAFRKHAIRIASAGVGLTVLGTNGEAIHVSPAERVTLVRHAREALAEAGMPSTPIIAGAGGGSLRETIQHSKALSDAGADAVIVITPGFFAGNIAKDGKALREFFWQTAEHSPVPVLVYNFPAVTSGIDLDTDVLEEICKHPNVLGVKLTCASVGKGERLVHLPERKGSNFQVFPGFADILLPSMLVGMTGTIAGAANLFPRLLVALYESCREFVNEPSSESLARARELQRLVSRAEYELCKGGVAGTKWALRRFYYETGEARRPLQPISQQVASAIEAGLTEAMEWERKAERAAGVPQDLIARV